MFRGVLSETEISMTHTHLVFEIGFIRFVCWEASAFLNWYQRSEIKTYSEKFSVRLFGLTTSKKSIVSQVVLSETDVFHIWVKTRE